jgi:1-acyl-sn-glycerol-3-phosphate acyltransferase
MVFIKNINHLGRNFWYRLGRLAVSLLARGGLELTVQWKAPIPDGPKILVANHPSTIDPAILTTLVKDHINILIHGELFKIPFFGKSLRGCGHIPVCEGGGAWALEEAQRRLQAGESVAIFPEGEISPTDGPFKTIHSGAARLAICSGVPVIPIGIHLDAKQIRVTKSRIDDQEELGTWYFHGPYALTIGHSMTFSGEVESRQLVREVSEQIKARIVALSIESASRVRSKRKLNWARATRWWLWAPVRLVRSWSVLANNQINY